AEDMKRLETRQASLETAMAQEAEAIEKEKQAVRAERQQAQDRLAAARRAKESFDLGVTAIEAVLVETENETLTYDPNTGKTTMQDPTPVQNAPPKLRTQIVQLAKRLAFVESRLFARIFRLDEQISRLRAFLERNDVDRQAKRDAQQIIDDVASDEPEMR
ncbi:hypothetical protein SAMN06273572_1101, partial [Monaibacterium marinum]